jgi:hypothetical protein
MWASFRDYWNDFKAGREGARYFAAFCLFLGWLFYMGLTQ